MLPWPCFFFFLFPHNVYTSSHQGHFHFHLTFSSIFPHRLFSESRLQMCVMERGTVMHALRSYRQTRISALVCSISPQALSMPDGTWPTSSPQQPSLRMWDWAVSSCMQRRIMMLLYICYICNSFANHLLCVWPMSMCVTVSWYVWTFVYACWQGSQGCWYDC